MRLDPEDEYLRGQCYVMTTVRGCQYAYLSAGIPLHRHLMDNPIGLDVDHINGDGLDNRKSNLRVVSRSVNNQNTEGHRHNTSGFKGVSYRQRNRDWRAYIKHQGKMIWLGCFKTREDANLARLTKEKELWGIAPRRLPAFQAVGLA